MTEVLLLPVTLDERESRTARNPKRKKTYDVVWEKNSVNSADSTE